jgi:DNA polymerase III delta prime subunit
MKLANGDMRRSLNVLQACHMAYDAVTEASVYACTGNPLPSDLKLMLNMLNNQPMQQAFDGQTSENRMRELNVLLSRRLLNFCVHLCMRSQASLASKLRRACHCWTW